MKKLTIILLATLLMFMSVNDVKADYNGTNGSATPGSGTCNPGWSSPCTWDNAHFTAVQLTLIYYDGNNWIRLGKPYYITNYNTGHYNRLVAGAAPNRVLQTTDINTCGGSTSGIHGSTPNCRYNSAWLEQRYSDTSSNKAQAEKNVNELFSAMGVKPSDLTRPHNGTINYNSRGYRILIEPVLNWYYGGITQYLTIKQVFRTGGTTNSAQHEGQSWLLHTERDDIGIRAYGQPNGDPGTIANPRTGYGYNIINPASGAIKQCYKLNIEGTNPVCKNTNKQNTGFYREIFKVTDCESDKTNVVENATQYGRLVKTVNNNCKIYCTEEVEVKYPGNVLPAIQTGGKFVWPTFGTGQSKIHNLNIKGTRSCTVVGGGCGNYKATVEDLYGDFKSSVTLKYNHENYKDNITLDKAKDTANCDNCTALTDSKKLTVTHDIELKLPKDTYRYVNKQTTIASSTNKGNSSLYTDIGYGNLPISNNAKTDKKYQLELTNIQLGAKGIFSDKAKETPYKCTYRAKNTPNSCVCPPGTKGSGKDLYCKIVTDSPDGMNCPTAQQQYCNDTSFTTTYDEESCPPGTSKYCPEPNQHISLESCIAAGNSYNTCYSKLCTGDGPGEDPGTDPKIYQCPKNTPNAYMDISWCVESLMAKGQSQAEAIKVCQDVVCPLDGIPIIYRTISLRNPFPSKNLNGGIKGFNTDNISGRYPGANWNSKKLVEVEIRNNRGVADNEVYKKTPLYKFVLTADTIREIRSYNKKQATGAGYSDFTLNCVGENAAGVKDGSKCISRTFLRTTIAKAFQSGTCKNINASTFDTCAN